MGVGVRPGFVAIYRWKIAPEHVDVFRQRWLVATEQLYQVGGQGSLLGKADDGTYVAVALWPDRKTRDLAFSEIGARDEWPPAERLEPILIDPIENLWQH